MKNTIYAASIGLVLLGTSVQAMEHVFAANVANAFSLFFAQRIEREEQEGGVREADPELQLQQETTARQNTQSLHTQVQMCVMKLKKWFVNQGHRENSTDSTLCTDSDDPNMIPMQRLPKKSS